MAPDALLGSTPPDAPGDAAMRLGKGQSATQVWDLPPLPPESQREEKVVPFITVEDPPESGTSSASSVKSTAIIPVTFASPSVTAAEARAPPVARSVSDGPMSVALDGPNPSPHFVSLENIARLYIELKHDRDYLVHESGRIYHERVSVVTELRELEGQLTQLLQQKARLEDSLDKLGVRDEENRMKMAVIDDKVANISCESQRFEATVRELKGSNYGTSASSSSDGATSTKAFVKTRPKPSAACRRTMYGHTGNVTGLDVCKDANLLISASSDKSLRTWDTSTGRRLDTLYGHDGWVHAVAFSAGGQRAVSGAGDKTVKVWDLGDARGRGTCKSTITGHEAGVTCVQMDDSNILVSGSLDKTLRRYDLNEAGLGKCSVITGHEQGVYCLQFVRHGLASGGGDSLIRMHDMRTGLCHRTLSGHTAGAVRALQFDDVQLVSGGADTMLRFWDLRTGGCTGAVETGTRVNAIHVDGTRVTVACGDHLVKVYDSESKRLIEEHGGHLGPVLSLAGYDRTFFTGSTDQTARMWFFAENKV